MSDPNQPPPEGQDRPDDGGYGDAPPPPPPGQGSYGTTPPPPPPDQGGYGTTPPAPPPGGWQQPGAMPPPGYQGATTGGIGQPADLWLRFAARLVDFVLLAIVNFLVVGIVVVGMLIGTSGGNVTGFGVTTGSSWAASAVSTILTTLITLAYFTFLESSRGQTLGKMLLKLETRGPDGGRPTMEQALKRNAFTAIGVLGIIPVLGFIAPLLSLAAVIMVAVTINNNQATRRGWHDDFAGGTMVVRIG